MYSYDLLDREIVQNRVDEFRDQVERRIRGELTEEQFLPLRLMNGLYLQLHGYMLRVAIPYGTLSSMQMRRLARIARVYDKGYGHFTTRQNIQYNWPRLDQTPDILQELADVEMHAIQTSGNCIRNVTTDPYAGAAADEVEDPRITSEIIRQWSTFHPEFSFLPRKFKIAVTATPEDRAAVAVHDIGVRIVRNEEGDVGFEVLAGGGQGRTPHLAKVVRGFVPRSDLLGYLEAIMRVYNRFGRRDNKYKARIKILVNALGIEAFRREVESEWQAIRDEPRAVDVPRSEWDRVRAMFDAALPEASSETATFTPEVQAWMERSTHPHRVPGYAIVEISLKPHGGIPGDATAEQMDALADLADRYSRSDIRVTHRQNLVFPHVRVADLPALWQELVGLDLATANVGTITDIIACPGMDYCSLATTRSIPVAQQISERFAAPERLTQIGKLTINVSGCINACGHHHVGNIGILGVDKRGEEFFQISLGGSAGTDASLGTILGRAVPQSQVGETIDRIVEVYDAEKNDGETFLDTFRRIGSKPFKARVYAGDEEAA